MAGAGYCYATRRLSSQAAREGFLDWFRTTVQNRLNNPKTGAIIVVAQRLQRMIC